MRESEKLLDIDLHGIYDSRFDEASLLKRHFEKFLHQHFFVNKDLIGRSLFNISLLQKTLE
jgi:hypothetical protein